MTNRETEEKLRKLEAVEGRQADLGWLLYLSGESQERQDTDDLVDVLLHQRLGKDYRKGIFLEPPLATMCDGDYRLGNVLYPGNEAFGRFGLCEDEWIKHVLIVGMTGAGKTNLAFGILETLSDHGKPFLVFDWKRNYRDLKQLPGFADMRVFTVGHSVSPFAFNPLLPPPGIGPGQWLMKLVDVIKHAYFVGEGVEYLLRHAIDQVYEQCGLLDGTNIATPTFMMIREVVDHMRLQGRMSLWKASTTRVLESLCFRHGLGPMVNVDEGWNHEALLEGNVVLELDALSDSDKIFLIEALILWIYEYRKNRGKREKFAHALVIEEAHHVLSQFKELHEGAETIMETCLRQIREFGESVIVIDQEPTKLSNSIKANTYTKVCFNLGNGKDVLEMSNCMGLDEEEADCLKLLEVGHAVVSLKGRVFQPLHVGFPRMDVRKGTVADDALHQD